MDDKRSKSYLKQKKKKAESCGESWSTKSWKDMAHYILHIDYTHTEIERLKSVILCIEIVNLEKFHT